MQIAPETMHRIAALFKGFDDPTRIHILSLLIEGERCVGEIADTMNLTQSAVSHQLRILAEAGYIGVAGHIILAVVVITHHADVVRHT